MPLIPFLFVSSELCSLAYFSPNLTVNNLATYFTSGHDPSVLGTYTPWDILLQELYLPFRKRM